MNNEDQAPQRSAAKQALLRERLRRKHSQNRSPGSIGRRPASGAAPLSFAQQRLWFLQQLEPNSPAYHIVTAFHLRGQLNVQALTQTAREIMRRHQILRSTFHIADGQAVQIVHPEAHRHLVIPCIDLQEGSPEELMRAAYQYMAEEVQRPFNLAIDMPWRTCLLQLAADEYVSLTIMHHLVSDAWSTELFFREVGELYAAFRAGQSPALAEPSLQYADYAYWQRQRLQDGSLDAQMAYWKQQLKGPLPALEFPGDYPRPQTPGYRGKRAHLHIPQALSQTLHQFCRQENITLFMALLALFKVLLYHYTMQEDLLVGTPIAGRTRLEMENMLGCFLNTLVLRTDLSGNPTFHELVRRVRQVTLDAFDHQDVPFEKLVEELQSERDLSRHPLFQVLFILQNVPLAAYDLAGLASEQITPTTGTAKFDMEWCLYESEQELNGYIEYNSDLFKPETIEHLGQAFLRVLEHATTHPEQRIGDFSLAPSIQWRQQHTREAEQPRQCLHTLFEQQAALTPDAIALSGEEGALTYSELNLRANQLAHYLLNSGIQIGARIGICMEHGFQLVIGLLAILKSGAAYVPLDPIHISARLHAIIDNAHITFLLIEQRYTTILTTEHIQTVAIESISIDHLPTDDPAVAVKDTDLAYIIYTSGSTGQPKGVMISHAHVVSLFAATQELYHFGAHDVWTLFHSYAFDVSVWEMWGALLHGGRLVIVPYWVTRSPVDFYRLLHSEQITILNQTPSAFYQLLHVEDTVAYQQALALRLIIFAGEALDIHRLQPWFERHGDQQPRLVNMYGLTEVTIHATYRFIERTDVAAAIASPIGYALPGLRLYVLNRHLQPVPIGASGELYIGGERLALGYVNNPQLTSERFTSHLAWEPRLYRTGDIVRCLPDGDLEYRGRNDQQIKIRGYRIEPAEIEAVLGRHPALRESVIVVHELSPVDKRLVAYVVPHQGQTLTPKALRSFLQERLPQYMIPATFVLLETLPLTANGKLDRKALPAAITPLSTAPRTEAHTVTEEKLVSIWCQLLHTEQIGTDEDFFELGGHSLLAVQLSSHIRELMQIEVPVWTIFRAPTIAALAEAIERLQTMQDSEPSPSLRPVARELYRRKDGDFE